MAACINKKQHQKLVLLRIFCYIKYNSHIAAHAVSIQITFEFATQWYSLDYVMPPCIIRKSMMADMRHCKLIDLHIDI